MIYYIKIQEDYLLWNRHTKVHEKVDIAYWGSFNPKLANMDGSVSCCSVASCVDGGPFVKGVSQVLTAEEIKVIVGGQSNQLIPGWQNLRSITKADYDRLNTANNCEEAWKIISELCYTNLR